MTGMWSAEEILAFVGERAVFARTRDAHYAELPAWLRRHPGDDPPPWDEQVAWIHLRDRPEAVRAWWQAIDQPGKPVAVRFLSSVGGDAWRQVEGTYLNLLDHPEVGAVLVIRDDLGPADPPEEQPPDNALADYDAPTWIIQHLDDLGTVLRTEGHVEEVFGRPAEVLAGENVLGVLHPDDHDAAIAMWLEVVAEDGATRTIRQRIVRPDGSWVWIESTVMNQLAQTGAVVAVSHDVSARKQQEAALRASEQELRTLAESVPAAVFRATADGSVTFANSLWYELTAPCGPIGSLHQLVSPAEAGPLLASWGELVGGRGAFELDVSAIDGRTLRLRCRSVPTPTGDVVLGTIDDVSAEVEATTELRRQVERDALTGLVNRAGLARFLAAALGGEATAEAVLVFVDLDGFKVVNDTWGHRVGDGVLEEVAGRLRTAVRPNDIVARYGGDEFVLLCTDVPAGEDQAIVERIEHALEQPVVVDGHEWRAAASVGVVRPHPGETVESAVHRADGEMYQRKRSRRAAATR